MRQVERCERLVCEDPFRLASQNPGKQGPRPLAARQLRGWPAPQIVQSQRGNSGLHRLLPAVPVRQPAHSDERFDSDVPCDFSSLREIPETFCTHPRSNFGQCDIAQNAQFRHPVSRRLPDMRGASICLLRWGRK